MVLVLLLAVLVQRFVLSVPPGFKLPSGELIGGGGKALLIILFFQLSSYTLSDSVLVKLD